jgi:hypothetical protein
VKGLALKSSKTKAKSLDSGFRRNDELKSKNWIPAFAGMTSGERAKAGFQLSLE